MSKNKSYKQIGEIRASQSLTTYAPGSLVDFPDDAVIMGGLLFWPKKRTRVLEARLQSKMANALGQPGVRLIAPPVADGAPWEKGPRVTALRFPNWFLANLDGTEAAGADGRTRLLVPRDRCRVVRGRLRFEDRSVVPIRFVSACTRGHIQDVDWNYAIHGANGACKGLPIYLQEKGSGGDLADLVLRCECGATRSMADLADPSAAAMGKCKGRRPWLPANHEDCDQMARLLTRTATNAYFAQTMSALSVPETKSAVERAVESFWSEIAEIDDGVKSVDDVAQMRKYNKAIAKELGDASHEEVLAAIQKRESGAASQDRVKEAEIKSILAAPTKVAKGIPQGEDFLARRLPDSLWRKSGQWPEVASVIQLHRLREVVALMGFTRFEPRVANIHGEYDGDVEVAAIDINPGEYPAVENRGEGIFIELNSKRVDAWVDSKGVQQRIASLQEGYRHWCEDRKHTGEWVGAPFVLLHTLSHLLIQSVAMTCGYPASSIRERIYVENGNYGILLYTASPDAEGTLGGLVSQARRMGEHLERALRDAALCSNDPICSQHDPGESYEKRWLHGAACHGCSLIAETSCEMRNEHLDRALVVPVLGETQAAFFEGRG